MNDRLEFLREKTYRLTGSPGVYIMKNSSGRIIYIGKAKNLKNRVSSYFRESPDHTPKVAKMVENVYDYDFIVTDTEYEALVLECSLIKQHKPKYNILLKDDKGYHYIRISGGEYPRITAEMSRTGDGEFLGPYVSAFTVKQAVNEANRVFMLPTCTRRFPQEFGRGRPCLNYHIKQCIGVCRGMIPSDKYRLIVEEAIEYIRSGSARSIERMTEQMNEAAEALDFERAALLRDRIRAIERAADTQKIIDADLKSVDIVAVAQNSECCCASVLIYRNGRLLDKASFFLGERDSEEASLSGFLLQYYSEGGDIPREIMIESDIPDMELTERLLRERAGHAVTLISPKRGENTKLTMLAKSNAGEYLSMRIGRTGKEIAALEDLAKLLGLPSPPKYIEAYDISNLASSSMVAGMVVFENGRPLKSAYKRFSIKTIAVQNDYASMREVLERRFRRFLDGDSDSGFARLPDLILLDGGKGQVNAVAPVLAEMGINVPLFGMVKDNRHRTRAIATEGSEIAISGNKAAFDLVTRIQDEVHRYSITYQRNLHRKNSFASELTEINGIGVKKAERIITSFKTRKALLEATPDELAAAAGVNKKTAEELYLLIQKRFSEVTSE